VQLCDRGDGSPQSKEEARQKWAHLNGPRGHSRGHVPDVAVFTVPPTLHEYKAYTFANQKVALGLGTAGGGAKASTAEGHVTAFGGTEERLRWENLGVAQRGVVGGETFQRTTGEGYVAAHDGLYADALARGLPVLLCVMETSGAVGTTLAGVLRLLARTATATGATDATRYGLGRASTRSFYAHHIAEMSTAVQVADAIVLDNAAAHEMFAVSMGM
jgi:hypothetical protein